MNLAVLSNAERALFMETEIAQLVRWYGGSSKRLSGYIAGIDDVENFTRRRETAILRQVNDELALLDARAGRWSTAAMRESYSTGSAEAAKLLRAQAVPAEAADLGAVVHREAVRALAEQSALELTVANESIKRAIGSFVTATRQTVIEESLITENIARGIIEGEARRTVSARISAAIKDRLQSGKFVEIRARDGRLIHYDPDVYARMVALVRTREAASQGTINTCLQYGNDLVQISVHTNACSQCQPYQGRVYSISGATGDFPVLDARPPYHPYCRHVLLPVVESYLRSTGQYERLKELSANAKTRFASINDYARYVEPLAA